MSLKGVTTGVFSSKAQRNCPDTLGCPDGVCPDFTIKRFDTKPAFRVNLEDCDGPFDLTDELLVLETNMWARAKLKTAISITDDYFGFADGIGFEQVMQNDIIIMDRARLPKHMLVTGFDEANGLIRVQRGYNGTNVSSWKKGTPMRIFRALNASAEIETVKEDVLQVDGSTVNQVIGSYLVHQWDIKHTCLPGCYWLEFKLIKMSESMIQSLSTSVIPSFTSPSLTAEDFGCKLGDGVEWVRRFPSSGEGFLIKIQDSPTPEL